jgi:hypothetical protein
LIPEEEIIMDPITTTIIAAITAGAAKSIGQVAEKAIVDGYQALKSLIVRKLGDESKVVRAIKDIEDEPESKAYQAVLEEQVAKSGVDKDTEVVKAAQGLQEQIKAQPDGEQHIQSASGSYIAQADRGGRASVQVNLPDPDKSLD